MTRTLVIMRHAKSSWDDATLADHERPLTERGKADAVAMGEELARRAITPDLILCSEAKRARVTVKRVLRSLEPAPAVRLLPELYGASAEECLRALVEHGGEAQVVLVVGHNPGLEELASRLCARVMALSAGAMACFSLPIGAWAEASAVVQGQLIWALAPRDLPVRAAGSGA